MYILELQINQSYKPSCSHTSTRKSTISGRGIGRENRLFIPNKLSYVAFQLIVGSRTLAFVWEEDPFASHCCLVCNQRLNPLLTNSLGLLLLAEVAVLLVKLIEDTLLCDCIVLLSISQVLVLQKSSDTLGFLTRRPWILNPLDGSSTATISGGLLQHPKQPLYPCNQVTGRSKKEYIDGYASTATKVTTF